MRVPAKVRAACDGLALPIGGCCFLVLLGVLSLLLLLQSPSDKLLWTGSKVAATERGGLIFYSWQGQPYTLDVPGFANKAHVTVFLDPGDPDTAITDSLPRRILDGLFIVAPMVLGVGVLGFGVWRRRSIQRNDARNGFGTGLDPDLVGRLLKEVRRPPP
jgi:hypothetical protein